MLLMGGRAMGCGDGAGIRRADARRKGGRREIMNRRINRRHKEASCNRCSSGDVWWWDAKRCVGSGGRCWTPRGRSGNLWGCLVPGHAAARQVENESAL